MISYEIHIKIRQKSKIEGLARYFGVGSHRFTWDSLLTRITGTPGIIRVVSPPSRAGVERCYATDSQYKIRTLDGFVLSLSVPLCVTK